RKDLGAAVIGSAEIQECLAAVVDDPRYSGEGLGVVDRRRFAVKAVARGKRRLEPGHALLAFERFEQRGFLPADVRAVAVVIVQVEGKTAAEDVVAEKAGAICLLQRFLA